jgi:hypothetical protein
MPLNELLKEEHWKDYDNKKIKDFRDSKFFACSESWEVNYLKNLIKEKHSKFSEDQILKAIKNCCETNKAPHPRKEFTECVLKKLGII